MAVIHTELSRLPACTSHRVLGTRLAVAGAILLGLCPSLAAQSRQVAAPARTTPQAEPQLPSMAVDLSTDTISFSMSESMELVDFIKWAQAVTGKRFTFSPMELQSASPGGGGVGFLGTFRIKRDRFQEDFFSFFQTMLYIKGFAVVPRGEGDLELLEIILASGQRGREVANSARYVKPDELPRYRFQTGVPILTTVALEHINATIATNALRPFFASTGSAGGGSLALGNVGNSSAMLLQGFGPQVYAAVQLLELVDQPPAPGSEAVGPEGGREPAEQPSRSVRVIVLEHADAATIERILNGGLGKESRPRRSPAPRKAASKFDDHRADDHRADDHRADDHRADDHRDKVEFSMAEEDGMELTDFIKWAQEVTGKRFTFNPVELASGSATGSRVHFLGALRVDRERAQEEFFSFFQTMLYIKGFALVPRGEGDLELFEIVMMAGQRGREVSSSARYVAPDDVDDYRCQAGVPILTTVTLANINATIATNALRPFFASTGAPHGGGSLTIGNVGNNSAMLLQGFGPQVYAAVQLLELVDRPADRSKLVAKALVDDNRKAVVISGTQRQIDGALDLIARLDVPGGGSGNQRGFGFTSFGQAMFQDTDDDGLPDTRLPDFDKPLQGTTGAGADEPGGQSARAKGKAVIY